MRQPVRWFFTAASLPFLVILYLNIEKYAESRGWDTFLLQLLEPATQREESEDSRLIRALTNPWMVYAAITVIGMTLGVWLDAVLKRLDAKKPTKQDKLREIGNECLGVGQLIVIRLQQERIGDWITDDITPHVASLIITLEQNSFPIPDIENFREPAIAEVLGRYFNMVGRLLVDGHFDQAREVAAQYSEFSPGEHS